MTTYTNNFPTFVVIQNLTVLYCSLIPFLHRGPLCLPCAATKLARSQLKAQRRPKGYLGRSRVAQRTFRPRHGRHGRREVLSMFKQLYKGHRRGRWLTGRSTEAGGRHTHRSGRRMNAQGSAIGRPVKKFVLLYTLCINLGDASTSLVSPLCFLWPTNSVHWAITVATTVTTATLEPPRQLFCLHSASFARTVVPL